MAARIRLQRVGVAGERPSACICFPDNEPPFFAFEIELEMLTRVKCPLHGRRFKPLYRIFAAKWLRAKQPQHLWTHHICRNRSDSMLAGSLLQQMREVLLALFQQRCDAVPPPSP